MFLSYSWYRHPGLHLHRRQGRRHQEHVQQDEGHGQEVDPDDDDLCSGDLFFQTAFFEHTLFDPVIVIVILCYSPPAIYDSERGQNLS